MGGWATSAGEGYYGNGLSRSSMRAMAGFSHNERIFYLPRACITPPDDLMKRIFAFVEEWEEMTTVSLILLLWVFFVY